jgi:hypothetical protein
MVVFGIMAILLHFHGDLVDSRQSAVLACILHRKTL